MEKDILIEQARTRQLSLEESLAGIDEEYAQKKRTLLVQLEAVKRFLTDYSSANPQTKRPSASGKPVTEAPIARSYTPRENSHKARILEAALELLTDDIQVRTPDLLKKIEAQGIEFKARDKAGNLSVILSKDPRFVSDRRLGWSLKK